MTSHFRRPESLLPVVATAVIGLQAMLPSALYAAPQHQGIAQTEEERWQSIQEAEQRAGERLRAWPQAYPLPADRPRPAYPGSFWQQPFPWELLGSPYLPVVPLREINYMGVQPTPDDPCYGRLARDYVTPVAFRLNYLEAAPYLEQGYGLDVLDAWAGYLVRPGTLPGAVERPDDGVAMVGGCLPLPPPADDALLASTPTGDQRHECGELARPPDPSRLTPQALTGVIGDWLRQCGYLVQGVPPQIR
jgi:hypothetical protein